MAESDSHGLAVYRATRLDDVEDIEKYKPGGYYPVSLYDTINGRFKIVHKLGQGGFATVWLARDMSEDKNVALKIFAADAPDNDLKYLKYIREQGVSHENIISLRDAFTIKGPNGTHQCLVLDAAGPTLMRIADGRHYLSKAMIRDAARQMTEAVANLHSIGICHGGKITQIKMTSVTNVSSDLTDSNVLFVLKDIDVWSEYQIYEHLGKPRTATVRLQSGAAPGPSAPRKVVEAIQYNDISGEQLTGRICITDFGESFFSQSPPRELLGTPAAFFSPEMLFGQSASTASDIWSLACLIYEIRALRPLICVFFGRLDEALGEVLHTLGPLPKIWRKFYFEKTVEIEENHWWFEDGEMRHPLETLVEEKMNPKPTAIEAANLLSLLRSALKYEPGSRISAYKLATHPWFTS